MVATSPEENAAKTLGVLDSLPYVDDQAPESYEDYAMSLIQAEMSQGQPQPLEPLPAVRCRTSLLEHEYPPKYESIKAPDTAKDAEAEASPIKAPASKNIDEWRAAVRQARTAYELERLRSVRLEVAKSSSSTYGGSNDAGIWKAYIPTVEAIHSSLTVANATQQEAVQKINYSRQQEQLAAGKEIKELENEFQERLRKINSLRQAIQGLKDQLN